MSIQKSSTEEKFLIAIARMRNILIRDIDRLLQQHDITTTQFSVLEVLYSKGEQCVGDIQKRILGTNGNIPVVIHNLEKNGYVMRQKSNQDGRISIIKLSNEGKKIMEILYPMQQQRLQTLLQNVDKTELDILNKQLKTIFDNIVEIQEREE